MAEDRGFLKGESFPLTMLTVSQPPPAKNLLSGSEAQAVLWRRIREPLQTRVDTRRRRTR